MFAIACGEGGEEGVEGGSEAASSRFDAPQAESAPGPDVTVFREHHLTDPGLNGLVATTLLVPEGWQVEGGLQRTGDALFRLPVVADVNVSAPDGRGVRFFPELNFSFGPQVTSIQLGPVGPMEPTINGNPYLDPPNSMSDWLMEQVRTNPDPRVRNLRVVSEESLPELRETLLRAQAAEIQQIEAQNQQNAWVGVRTDFELRADKIVLRYELEGRPTEETLLVVWQGWSTSTNGQLGQGQWAIRLMRSMRGPAGTDYLDDPVLAAIVQSVRVNPRWTQEMQKYWAELARIEHRGRMERMQQNAVAQQKLSQTYSEIGDIISQGYRTRTSIQDRGHQRSIDGIWEQTPYATGDGQTVELPSFYDEVYTDGDGRYILNNDQLWNPNRDQRFNQRDWTKIEPVR